MSDPVRSSPPDTHRLAIVLSHPTQYYSPWFRHLRQTTPLAFRVFYLWEFGIRIHRDPQFRTSFAWDVDLLSGYDHEFVPNVSRDPGTHHFTGLRNPVLTDRLTRWQPSALLVFGYKWAAHLRAIQWARTRRIPLLFRGDSHLLGRGALSWPKRLLLRTLYRQFAAFLAVGAANREYFSALGVPPGRLFFAPHAVDGSLFAPDRAGLANGVAELRRSLGIAPEVRTIVFAGKFTADKQPLPLLDAFLSLNPANAALVFVGDGPLKEALHRRALENPAAIVRFLPFANQSEMPTRLALADLLALPSRGCYETWGLVVNEAMHLGVPALVSDRVGCQRDLVAEGETGWVFRADDAAGLRATLQRALEDVARPERRAALRRAVRSRISGYTYTQTTAGLLAALASVPVSQRR